MAINYSDAVKTARMGAVVTAIGTNGKIVLKTAADAVVATATMATAPTVAGSGAAVKMTLNGTISDTNAAGSASPMTKAEIQTSAGAVVVSGLTVGTSATDIILASVTASAGSTVTITTGGASYITHAA